MASLARRLLCRPERNTLAQKLMQTREGFATTQTSLTLAQPATRNPLSSMGRAQDLLSGTMARSIAAQTVAACARIKGFQNSLREISIGQDECQPNCVTSSCVSFRVATSLSPKYLSNCAINSSGGPCSMIFLTFLFRPINRPKPIQITDS